MVATGGGQWWMQAAPDHTHTQWGAQEGLAVRRGRGGGVHAGRRARGERGDAGGKSPPSTAKPLARQVAPPGVGGGAKGRALAAAASAAANVARSRDRRPRRPTPRPPAGTSGGEKDPPPRPPEETPPPSLPSEAGRYLQRTEAPLLTRSAATARRSGGLVSNPPALPLRCCWTAGGWWG